MAKQVITVKMLHSFLICAVVLFAGVYARSETIIGKHCAADLCSYLWVKAELLNCEIVADEREVCVYV